MKDKICMICKTAIDVEKEYAEFKHYTRRDEIRSKAFYHIECFKERLKGGLAQQAVAQKAMQILSKIEGRVPA
jgi:hypothetical protein